MKAGFIMSMFPDCRKDDVYNADFLNALDTEFVNGFDFVAEQLQNLFQGNLDVYEQELTETLEEDEEPEDDEVFATRPDLYEIISENSELILTIILDWLEKGRDELITSMIDSMDEKEFKELRRKALEANKDKEYFDTRHWVATGEKRRTNFEESEAIDTVESKKQ